MSFETLSISGTKDYYGSLIEALAASFEIEGIWKIAWEDSRSRRHRWVRLLLGDTYYWSRQVLPQQGPPILMVLAPEHQFKSWYS